MKTKTERSGRVTRRTTPAERKELIKEYHASGMGRREFAESKGINPLTFHGWFRKRSCRKSQEKAAVKFVKAALPEMKGSRIGLVAEYRSGLRIHINGLGIREAAAFIREVASCSI